MMCLILYCFFLMIQLAQGLSIGIIRKMEEIITTTDCNVRVRGYEARLDMYYFYKVVYKDALDLVDVEHALANAVVSSLNDCDENSEPLYAIEVNGQSHKESGAAGTLCEIENTLGQSCSLIRGETSILLDNGVGQLDTVVYDILENTLKDTLYLQQFTSQNLIRAVFIYGIGESLTVLGEADEVTTQQNNGKGLSNGTLKVALSFVVVSIIVASIFIYSLISNRQPDLRSRSNDSNTKAKVDRTRRLQYFEELDDHPSLSPGWMTTNELIPETKTPSTTWSVSDLTTDTLSIKESLPMERIEEEVVNDAQEDEVPTNESPVSNVKVEGCETINYTSLNTTSKDATGSIVESVQHSLKSTADGKSCKGTNTFPIIDDISTAIVGSEFDFYKIIHPDTDDEMPLQIVKSVDQFDAVPNFFTRGCSFWVDQQSEIGYEASQSSESTQEHTNTTQKSRLDDTISIATPINLINREENSFVQVPETPKPSSSRRSIPFVTQNNIILQNVEFSNHD